MKTTRTKLGQSLLAWITCLYAATSAAHNDSWHGAPGPNGGTLERAGDYRMELCLEAGKVRIWVWNHFREGAPIPVKDGSGFVTVTAGGVQTNVTINPQLGNLLEGTVDPVKTAISEITVSVRLPARSSRTVRFTDLRRAKRCNS